MKIKPSTIILSIQSRQAAGDKIGAIKYARKRLACGLAEAKEFCDYVAWRTGQADTVADIHSDWCYECYDAKPCKHPHPEPQIVEAVTQLIEKPVFEDALSESIPPAHRAKGTAKPKPQPSVSALIEQNKDRCPCGRKPCTDEFHANLAALIRKYGSTRAVELVWIAAGIKEPENEEQARIVEAQPGYKRFYKELRQ